MLGGAPNKKKKSTLLKKPARATVKKLDADTAATAATAAINQKKKIPYTSEHVVVDGLNMTHWMMGDKTKITPEIIKNCVIKAGKQLKARFKGRVMIVLKDRTNQFNDNDTHAEIQKLARESGCYIYIVERYKEPPRDITKPNNTSKEAKHAAVGRDDFYATLLARKWRCGVLTEDRLRDFGEFRQNIPAFQIYEFVGYKNTPIRDYVTPSAPIYRDLRVQRRLNFSEYITK
jgi:hypothetical protein